MLLTRMNIRGLHPISPKSRRYYRGLFEKISLCFSNARALVLIALGPTVSSVVVELLSSLPLGWCFPLRPGELKMSSLSLLFPLYRSSIQPKASLITSLIPIQKKF